jgi:hypothetical protein
MGKAKPAPARAEHEGHATASAPTYKLTMEIKDSPISSEMWFHDVIRNEHVLALCYDTRCVGFPRTRIRLQAEDIAIHLAGSVELYICTDPGISFVHNNDEITIYLIKSTHPMQPENAVPQIPGLL